MNLTPENEQENRNVIPFYRSGDYFFHRGIIAYRKNHLKRAVKLFERAVKLTDQEPVFHVQLAAVLSEIGQYERSNDILEMVLTNHGDDQSECYFFMANNYAYLGLFEKAEEAAKRYMVLTPGGEFFKDAGDLLDLMQVEQNEAEADADDEEDWESFDLSSDEYIIEHGRARTLLRDGKPEEALPILQDIITEHPACWSAHNHLAEALFRLGDDSAFELSRNVLQEDEGNLFALCNLAVFYTMKEDDLSASPFIDAIKRIYPLDIEHHMKVAQVLAAVGHYEQVIGRIMRVEPFILEREPDLFHCLAVAYYHTDQYEKALFYWRRAEKLGNKAAAEILKKVEQGTLLARNVEYRLW
ncbi:tetratricopeptide repeat protein [Alkalihalophilus marmarensis]|uniref:tetratricopeptide repeat protein n=1 Tax=Alkalihalophilus marmarensis TaxID=521377 RepID=UPI002E1CF390|nr:tetratricopeptide repeat protein [Alkalihalophilus marmarensis]